jgi:hypothetical protein
MTVKEIIALCDIATVDKKTARSQAVKKLSTAFLTGLKPVSKWTDEYIASWEKHKTAHEITSAYGAFWLTPPTRRTLLPPHPKITPYQLRDLALAVYGKR